MPDLLYYMATIFLYTSIPIGQVSLWASKTFFSSKCHVKIHITVQYEIYCNQISELYFV